MSTTLRTVQYILRVFPVPYVLYICLVLRLHQQSLLVPIFRLPQGVPNHHWVPVVFGCSITNGHGREATDEYSEQNI